MDKSGCVSSRVPSYLMAYLELADREHEYLQKLTFYQEVVFVVERIHRIFVLFSHGLLVVCSATNVNFHQELAKLVGIKPLIVPRKRLADKIFWPYFHCDDLIPYTEYLARELAARKAKIMARASVQLFDMDWKVWVEHNATSGK